MSTFGKKLEQYAEVIVKVGLNVQPGQRLLIWSAPYEAAPFVRAVVRLAYQAGARYVGVYYEDQELLKSWLEHGDLDSFSEYLLDDMEILQKYGQRGDALLLVRGNDPQFLRAYPQERAQSIQTAMSLNLGIYRQLIGGGEINRCVAVAPTQAYADVVLPDVPPAERLERFWELVFQLCRIEGEDAIQNWQRHNEYLALRSKYLNDKNYSALHFTAPGTDLTVGLPQGHIWFSGQKLSKTGVPFIANIPTEEVFTTPDRKRVDGVVQNTRPLAFGGMTVEDFRLTFEKGRVVEIDSDSGAVDLIRSYVETDENSGFAGEIALVPNSSPISQTGRTFYNIMYDENAACHIALGSAYRMTIQDGIAMSDVEFLAAGGNISNLHLDFMIGSGEMDVDGISKDGRREPLLRAGEWVDHA